MTRMNNSTTLSLAAVCLLCAPAATAAEPAQEGTTTEEPKQPSPGVDAAPPKDTPPLRIAVYDFDVSGVEAQKGRVVMQGVLAELRKLDRVSVIGMDEVRAMLSHEVQKQLLGCSKESCLSEIADALGVDVLVIGSLSRTGDENIFGMRRLDEKEGKVTGSVVRRFAAANGEEFLAAIGPGVAELFKDVPLRAGEKRGVDKELALRLNPPPLAPWVFWSGVGVTGAVAATATVFGALSAAAAADHAAYLKLGQTADINLAFLEEKRSAANDDAVVAYCFLGGAAVAAAGTAVSGLFTDFWGYGDGEVTR
jgi:hypothetical protein